MAAAAAQHSGLCWGLCPAWSLLFNLPQDRNAPLPAVDPPLPTPGHRTPELQLLPGLGWAAWWLCPWSGDKRELGGCGAVPLRPGHTAHPMSLGSTGHSKHLCRTWTKFATSARWPWLPLRILILNVSLLTCGHHTWLLQLSLLWLFPVSQRPSGVQCRMKHSG